MKNRSSKTAGRHWRADVFRSLMASQPESGWTLGDLREELLSDRRVPDAEIPSLSTMYRSWKGNNTAGPQTEKLLLGVARALGCTVDTLIYTPPPKPRRRKVRHGA